eukprot:469884_1
MIMPIKYLSDLMIKTQKQIRTLCSVNDGTCVEWWRPNNVDSADCAIAYFMGNSLSGGNRACTRIITKNIACNINTHSTSTTPGTRDCSVLAIDEFLLRCSSEFPAAQQQIIDSDNRLLALETNLQGQ